MEQDRNAGELTERQREQEFIKGVVSRAGEMSDETLRRVAALLRPAITETKT